MATSNPIDPIRASAGTIALVPLSAFPPPQATLPDPLQRPARSRPIVSIRASAERIEHAVFGDGGGGELSATDEHVSLPRRHVELLHRNAAPSVISRRQHQLLSVPSSSPQDSDDDGVEDHDMSTHVNIVGGGIAGLVAAIELASHGQKVSLYERQPGLGGLATTSNDGYRANIGPRALYTNNPLYPWLVDRGLLPDLARPGLRDLSAFGFVEGSRVRRPLRVLPTAIPRLRTEAPVGPSYREWATERFGESTAGRLIGLASLPLFHHDPGVLSAASVQRVLRDAFLDGKVTYIRGGWNRLSHTLTQAARSVGVDIHTDADITALPEPPVVLAIPLPAARRLLDDPLLDWPSAPTALLDVGVRRGIRRPAAFGLDTHTYAARYTHWDANLAPSGHDLIQAQTGLGPDERLDAGVARIEDHLDVAFPAWRVAETWRHRAVMKNGAGPADPPGTTWRDRPSVERGDGIYIVNDRVARPGLLSGVAVRAALDVACAITHR
jgi:hypothetical protein